MIERAPYRVNRSAVHSSRFALCSLRLFLVSLCLLPLTAWAQAAPFGITCTLTPRPPAREDAEVYTRVVIHLSGMSDTGSVRFRMPTWSPGDYHVQDHARYVRNARAGTASTGELPVTRPDPNTWEVQTRDLNDLQFAYDLPNTPPGLFSENVRVNSQYAFYNGPATFMYVVGHEKTPVELRVVLPEGWKRVVVPLEPLSEAEVVTGVAGFRAPDYDTLADSPILVGECVVRGFEEVGRPHTVAFFNDHEGLDYDAFVPILRRLVVAQNRMMGGPPYRRYVFFFDIGGRGGGLEHLNSCRIAWRRRTPLRALGPFAAHEFYHLWNVKRIRPLVLGPFDYIKPPHTRNLWFAEGVTEYLAYLSLRRAGLRTETEYLQGISGGLSALQTTPARKRVTADESSLRVWEANNSEGYGGLSYYLKGEVIGLCLDLKLRGVTDGRASLETVMRDLLARYGLPKPGYPEDGIRDAVIRAGGAEMGPFYVRLCRTTEELPLAECLRYVGLRLRGSGTGSLSIEPDPEASDQARLLREAWMQEGAEAHDDAGRARTSRAIGDRGHDKKILQPRAELAGV